MRNKNVFAHISSARREYGFYASWTLLAMCGLGIFDSSSVGPACVLVCDILHVKRDRSSEYSSFVET